MSKSSEDNLLARAREAARNAKACEKHGGKLGLALVLSHGEGTAAPSPGGCDACANAVVRTVADVLLGELTDEAIMAAAQELGHIIVPDDVARRAASDPSQMHMAIPISTVRGGVVRVPTVLAAFAAQRKALGSP